MPTTRRKRYTDRKTNSKGQDICFDNLLMQWVLIESISDHDIDTYTIEVPTERAASATSEHSSDFADTVRVTETFSGFDSGGSFGGNDY